MLNMCPNLPHITNQLQTPHASNFSASVVRAGLDICKHIDSVQLPIPLIEKYINLLCKEIYTKAPRKIRMSLPWPALFTSGILIDGVDSLDYPNLGHAIVACFDSLAKHDINRLRDVSDLIEILHAYVNCEFFEQLSFNKSEDWLGGKNQHYIYHSLSPDYYIDTNTNSIWYSKYAKITYDGVTWLTDSKKIRGVIPANFDHVNHVKPHIRIDKFTGLPTGGYADKELPVLGELLVCVNGESGWVHGLTVDRRHNLRIKLRNADRFKREDPTTEYFHVPYKDLQTKINLPMNGFVNVPLWWKADVANTMSIRGITVPFSKGKKDDNVL